MARPVPHKSAVSADPDFGSQKSKVDPSAGPHEGRGEVASPVRFKYTLLNGPMQLGSPRFPEFVTTGLPRGVRMPKLAKWAIFGGRPGLAFVAISWRQALNHGT